MRTLIFGFIIGLTPQSWAHGMDKPGPHGGLITMPAAFHVEVVPAGARQVKVYLLDVAFKNPTLAESSVEVVRNSATAQCQTAQDHFVCDFPAAVDLTQPGQLKVTAIRQKLKGAPAIYPLPFKTFPQQKGD